MAKELTAGEKQAAGVTYDKTKMAKVVDNFVRFLLGDADVAVSKLKTLGNPGVTGLMGGEDSSTELSTYNVMYDKLYAAFMAAVKKILK